jgi:hypothetical protein
MTYDVCGRTSYTLYSVTDHERTRAASWTNRVGRLLRLAEELRSEGFEVLEPRYLRVPPERRVVDK